MPSIVLNIDEGDVSSAEGEVCEMRMSYVCGELREELGRRGNKC